MNIRNRHGVSFAKANSINDFLSFINYKNSNDFNTKIFKLIRLLLDESIDVLPPLNERSTYILRKRYGFFDNGQNQPLSKISSELSVSSQRVSQILELAEEMFLMYLFRKSSDKISTLELSKNYDDYKDMSISEIVSNPIAIRRCVRNNIFTLNDLLEHSRYDLNLIIGVDGVLIEKIEKRINEMGLKFFEQLNQTEKKCLIKKSSKERILSSSAEHNLELTNVLNIRIVDLNISNRAKNILLRNNLNTVGDIIKLRSDEFVNFKNSGEISQNEIIDVIHSFGLSFSNELPLTKYNPDEIYKQSDKEKNLKVKKL